MRDLPLKQKISSLEVYCPIQREGCGVVMKLGELNSHEDECSFAPVVCIQGCGKVMFHKDIIQHCTQECSRRKIKCKYCGMKDRIDVIMGRHTKVCEHYPVSCPRGCCLLGGLYKRKDIVEHAKICPLENVLCPFHDAGCEAVILRRDILSHVESSTQQHLMKIMTAYNKLKEDVEELSSQIESLTLFEPTMLTEEYQIFSFSIVTSDGWVGPLREGQQPAYCCSKEN